MTPGEAIVLRMFDALTKGDASEVRSTLTKDFRFDSADVDQFIEMEFAFLGSFSDLHYEIDDIFTAGDRVTTRWRFVGHHDGDQGPGLLRGVPPTDRRVDIEGIAIARIESGLIAQWWGHWNALALHQALGILPTP